MPILKKSIILFILLLCAHATLWASEDLIIEQAWIREGPPRATVLAGYLTIKNTGASDHTLLSASSPQFEVTEMHESFEENGMARMRKHDRLIIPARGQLKFTPSAYHLMLMDPFQRIRAGTDVRLILEFDGLAPITVTAPVKRKID